MNNGDLISMEELILSGQVKGREALAWLDEHKKLVYHGSHQKLASLVPRQPYNFDKERKSLVPDGDPAVCATRDYRIAIFRSLISNHIDKEAGLKHHSSSFGHANGQVWMKASRDSLDRARTEGAVGYVYVFNMKEFVQYRGTEWRSSQEVKPVCAIEVTGGDLWEGIEVVEKPFHDKQNLMSN